MGISTAVLKEMNAKAKDEFVKIEKLAEKSENEKLIRAVKKAKEYMEKDAFQFLKLEREAKKKIESFYEVEIKNSEEKYRKLGDILEREGVEFENLELYFEKGREDIENYDIEHVQSKINEMEEKIKKITDMREEEIKRVAEMRKNPVKFKKRGLLERYSEVTDLWESLTRKLDNERIRMKREIDEVRKNIPEIFKVEEIEKLEYANGLTAFLLTSELWGTIGRRKKEAIRNKTESMKKLIADAREIGCDVVHEEIALENAKDFARLKKIEEGVRNKCTGKDMECIKHARAKIEKIKNLGYRTDDFVKHMGKVMDLFNQKQYRECYELCRRLLLKIEVRGELKKEVEELKSNLGYLEGEIKKEIEDFLNYVESEKSEERVSSRMIELRETLRNKVIDDYEYVVEAIKECTVAGISLGVEKQEISMIKTLVDEGKFIEGLKIITRVKKNIMMKISAEIEPKIRILKLEGAGDRQVQESLRMLEKAKEEKNSLKILKYFVEAKDLAYERKVDMYWEEIDQYHKIVSYIEDTGVDIEELNEELENMRKSLLGRDVLLYRKYSVNFNEIIEAKALEGIKILSLKIKKNFEDVKKLRIANSELIEKIRKFKEVYRHDRLQAFKILYTIYIDLTELIKNAKANKKDIVNCAKRLVSLKEMGIDIESLYYILSKMKDAFELGDFKKFDELKEKFDREEEKLKKSSKIQKIIDEIESLKDIFEYFNMQEKFDDMTRKFYRSRNFELGESVVFKLKYEIETEINRRIKEMKDLITEEERMSIEGALIGKDYKAIVENLKRIEVKIQAIYNMKREIHDKILEIGRLIKKSRELKLDVAAMERSYISLINNYLLNIELQFEEGLNFIDDFYGFSGYVACRMSEKKIKSFTIRNWGNYWLTDINAKNRVSPSDPEASIVPLISREDKLIYIENLNYLLLLNGFESVYNFLNTLKQHGIRVVLSGALSLLKDSERTKLESIFNKIIKVNDNMSFPMGNVFFVSEIKEADVLLSEKEMNFKGRVYVISSQYGKDRIDPERLDFEILEVVGSALKEGDVCMDCLNSLISTHSKKKVYLWLKYVGDIARKYDHRLYVVDDFPNTDFFKSIVDIALDDLSEVNVRKYDMEYLERELEAIILALNNKLKDITRKEIDGMNKDKSDDIRLDEECMRLYDTALQNYKKGNYSVALDHIREVRKRIERIRILIDDINTAREKVENNIEFVRNFKEVGEIYSMLRKFEEEYKAGDYEEARKSIKKCEKVIEEECANIVRFIKDWIENVRKAATALNIDIALSELERAINNRNGKQTVEIQNKIRNVIEEKMREIWARFRTLVIFVGENIGGLDVIFEELINDSKYYAIFNLIQNFEKTKNREIMKKLEEKKEKMKNIVDLYGNHGLEMSRFRDRMKTLKNVYEFIELNEDLRNFLETFIHNEEKNVFENLRKYDDGAAEKFREELEQDVQDSMWGKAIKQIDKAKEELVKRELGKL